MVALLLALGGVGAAAWTLRADSTIEAIAWVDMRPAARGAALDALLTRRATAVLAKDKAAFMADVDQTDAAFVKREQLLFDNLSKMPFAELRFEQQPLSKQYGLGRFLPAALVDRYRAAVYVAPVVINHRIDGVDSKTVAVPWLPVIGYSEGRWLVVGEAQGNELPYGANGQPWDSAGPIVVGRSQRVVAVLSADDADREAYLLRLAEEGLTRLAAVRPRGWDGKVFLTAIQDKRIFDTYFADSPERIAQVAAIAVPYYDRVPDWTDQPAFASTRVVFNPQELSAQPEDLAHDLVHEFTHAAMGPVTTGFTPRWLVEGFAEYVAYKGMNVSTTWVKRALGDLSLADGLPRDDAFYSKPGNYVAAWLACRMIAERYGQAKLIALYEGFQRMSSTDSLFPETLGVDRSTVETQWREYVQKQRQ